MSTYAGQLNPYNASMLFISRLHEFRRHSYAPARMAGMLFALGVALAGCDNSVPETRVIFPPPSSTFDGDVIGMRGEILAGNADRVSVAVMGSGVDALADIDTAINRWQAEVSLDGLTVEELTITTTNQRSGRISEQLVRLDRNAFTLRSTSIAAASDGSFSDNELYVIDVRLAAVVRISRVTGDRVTISSPRVGEGVDFIAPIQIEIVAGEMFVLDRNVGLVRVMPGNGDRIVVSGEAAGQGPAFVNPAVMLVRGDDIVVADTGLDALLSVDKQTGDRRIIFQAFTETDPVILSPQDMVAMPDRRILISDDFFGAILMIDPVSNSFDVISGFDAGTGPALRVPAAISLLDNAALLVLDRGRDGLLRIDLYSGDRTEFYSSESTAGSMPPALDIAVDMAVVDGTAFLLDNGAGAVISVNLSNGANSVVSVVAQGAGDGLLTPFDVALIDGEIVLSDSAADALVSINPGSGARLTRLASSQEIPFPNPDYINVSDQSVLVSYSLFDTPGLIEYFVADGRAETIASVSVGSGPFLILPTEPIARQATGELLVFDAFEQHVVSIDRATLERTVIYDDSGSPLVPFSNVAATTADESGETWYLLDSAASRIIELDIASGLRRLLLPASSQRTLVEIEIHGERLLLLDSDTSSLQAFNPFDGSIITLSGPGVGRGPAFDDPIQMTVDSVDSLAYVVDRGLDAVFVVDLITGDRVILSH